MQFAAIILAIATVASAAAIEPRQTCAAVTAKANACRDACNPSNWRCTVSCELTATKEYINCTGE